MNIDEITKTVQPEVKALLSAIFDACPRHELPEWIEISIKENWTDGSVEVDMQAGVFETIN